MEKVMLITNTPSPHRIALFNELKKQLFDEGFELRVVFGAFSYDRRKWKVDLSLCEFDYKVLNSRTIAWRGRDEHTLFTYKGLFREMISVRPEVIIVSGFSMATMQVCLFAYLFKVQYFIWTGSVIQRGRMTSLWRMWQRKLLVQRASGGIAYGTEARDYLHSVGIKKENVHIAINTIDTRYFRDQTAKYRVGQKGSSKKILTYVGYLTPRKNVSKVLELVAHLARQRSDFILEVIGDGNDLDELKSYVERNAISSHVRFYGHQNNDLLPKYLAKSDCFLFQTDFDIWGLVLNEAMAAGIPCLASVHAGATRDLVLEGKTGFSVDFKNQGAVLEKINWILDHPDQAKEIGNRASMFIEEKASLARSAAGFVEAIRHISIGQGISVV